MSKTKNTEEFRRMMEDQELAASFDYQEKEALMEQMAMEHGMLDATDEYIEAQKVFLIAQRKFTNALDVYKKSKGIMETERDSSAAVDMLTNLFKSFNPNT
jgi:hypothetical protein